MFATIRFFVLAAASVGVLLPLSPSHADGFPPFGAWAYGSGARYSGHAGYSRHITNLHRSAYWPSARATYGIANPYRRHRSVGFGYTNLYTSYYVQPTYSYYATYTLPSTYYPPIYTTPCYSTYAWPVVVPQVVVPQIVVPSFLPTCLSVQTTPTIATSLAPHYHASLPVSSTNSPTLPSVRYTSTTAQQETIPEKLLSVADSIFRAGGYREAAVAYAQLSVQYGSSDLLLTRRFVAQVASGDATQASLVSASANLVGARLDRSLLPEGSLTGLGLDVASIARTSESLAERAYRQPDADSLSTLGLWLRLAGDEERSQTFLAGAAQIAREQLGEAEKLDSRTEAFKSEFVSVK